MFLNQFKKIKNIYTCVFLATVLLSGPTSALPIHLTGIYWGAFDPPTEAHKAIIATALNEIDLAKLIIVVNNHSYKNYAFTLQSRLRLLEKYIQALKNKNVEILWQDDINPINIDELINITKGPLCAIAGYDAYKKWVDYTSVEKRNLYSATAVIPRADDLPILYDENAFILLIDPKLKYESSSKVRNELGL